LNNNSFSITIPELGEIILFLIKRSMKLQNKHIGSTIGIIIGVLSVLAPFGNKELFGSPAMYTGILIILGSLSYRFKKKQILSKTKRWPILEIITLILIFLHISFGISTGGWYENTLYYIIIPIWIIISYAILLIIKNKNIILV